MFYIVQNYEERDGQVFDQTRRVFKSYADAKMRQFSLATMCFEREFPQLMNGGSLFELRRFLKEFTKGDVFEYDNQNGGLCRVEVYPIDENE